MKKDFCKDFENKILSQLKKLAGEFDSLRIGVAVSGGADSISLLTALNSIFKERDKSLYVISVNHNIRPAEETCGDAAYVEQYCKKLQENGGKINFILKEIKSGFVVKTAGERGAGIEEAARFLRYSAFEEFISENKLDYLCLAHNKNDQEETLLMRFLQGSGVDSCSGISAKRGKYIRPLLETERFEIEKYLKDQNILWRTDSTNSDTQYLRNRIRLELMPFLNQKFPGWQNAVLNGGKKALIDGEYISEQTDTAFCELKKNTVFSVDKFLEYAPSIQQRLLVKLCNEKGCRSRIPFVFLQDVLNEIRERKTFNKRFANIEISVLNGNILIKTISKTQTDLVFFDIIEESKTINLPFGLVEIKEDKDIKTLIINDSAVQLEINFPFCIRNAQVDDEIECKDGRFKKVADIYSDWHVNEEKRNLIPVIQELQTEKQVLKCIFGEPFGFYNWVVRK